MRLTSSPIATRWLAGLAVIGVAVMVIGAMTGEALADTRSPFGVGIAETAPAASGGVFGWIAQQQRAMYRGLTGAIRAIHADGWAVTGLASLSFLYGVFHAAGPGHGKAVIASYLLANNETLKRGIVLSFASAFVQASVAVSIVLVAALLFNATARTMTQAAYGVEVASYGLVLALGLYLVWTKALRSGAVFTREPPPRALGAQAVSVSKDAGVVAQQPGDASKARESGQHEAVHRHDHSHAHGHNHDEHDQPHDHHCGHGAGCSHGSHRHHEHDDHSLAGRPAVAAEVVSASVSAIHTTLPVLTPAAGETTVQTGSSKTDAGHGDHHTHHHHHHAQDHGADHAHAHDAACGCGHSHAPDPRQLQGAFDWRRGIAVVLAAGLRPCSGAIIVLVFALSQGLLWAGVASAYAMALGTGITVAALAALAVSGSALAVQLAGRGSPWAGRVQRTVEIGGSLAVLALGIILVGGALSGDGSL